VIDFLCIGAQKSGTTLLYEHLKRADAIFLPKQKELHFFDNDENYLQGSKWYENFFIDAQDEQIKGEITPAYLFFECVPARIKETIKSHDDLKFIVLLRNPIYRAYSQYNMSLLVQKRETLTFEQALFYEKYRLSGYRGQVDYSYLSRGFYSRQIINYFKYFKRSQFKFVLYEDFISAQDKCVNEILYFLGVKEYGYFSNKVVFSNEYSSMNPCTEDILFKIYEEELNILENMLEIDLSLWRRR